MDSPLSFGFLLKKTQLDSSAGRHLSEKEYMLTKALGKKKSNKQTKKTTPMFLPLSFYSRT